MLVAVNGRQLYEPLAPPQHLLAPDAALPAQDTVAAALRREASLRKDPATLAKFMDSATDPIELIHSIQQRVGSEFELGPDASSIIRCARTLYPGCAEMSEIPHYVKYNRSCQGTVRQGDPVPSRLALVPVDAPGERLPLAHFAAGAGRPLIVAAGSIT